MCQVKNRSGKVFEGAVRKSFEDTVCVIVLVWNSQMRMKRSRVTGSPRGAVRCGAEGIMDIFPAMHCPLIHMNL